jgi:iron complex outermembrane receptor protein
MDMARIIGSKTITRRKSYVVARTGYYEKQVGLSLQNVKADAGLYFKFLNSSSCTWDIALLDTYTSVLTASVQNYFIQQHGLQFQSRSVMAKLYFNNENTGKSYNLRSVAENIDRNFKPDNQWYADYTSAFNSATASGASVALSHQQARAAADEGRYAPGTQAFKNTLNELSTINNWDSGAALRVKASFIQGEIQFNLTEQWLEKWRKNAGFEILTGISQRTYIIVPEETILLIPGRVKHTRIYITAEPMHFFL